MSIIREHNLETKNWENINKELKLSGRVVAEWLSDISQHIVFAITDNNGYEEIFKESEEKVARKRFEELCAQFTKEEEWVIKEFGIGKRVKEEKPKYKQVGIILQNKEVYCYSEVYMWEENGWLMISPLYDSGYIKINIDAIAVIEGERKEE